MGVITATTDATFDADVLGSAQPVLVDFWPNGVGRAVKSHPFSRKSTLSTARS